MAHFGTYDHENFVISFNGLRLTDFNGAVTVSNAGDDWDFVNGQNGSAERVRMNNRDYTVTLPMMQTSPQLNEIETLRIADRGAGAGPFPFFIKNLAGAYMIAGRAWVQNMGELSIDVAGGTRTITLRVYADAQFEGV